MIPDKKNNSKIKITPRTLERVFRYFEENVIKEKKDRFSPNERANLFVQLITNPQENYLHPKKRNILSTKAFGDVRIDSKQFRSFFGYFDGENYSPRQKEALTSSVDRIVEDVTRRSKGEFFTPTEFVDLAHDYITKQYGDDWKERFVVWDSCCGTLNLTRDYKFKELYCSTLEASDLETASQHGYNPEATKFQYDFLNDGPEKLPQGLRDAIEQGKEILFLINPPYFKPNSRSGVVNGGAGSNTTRVGDIMKKNKMGIASSQLSTQFMYRILEISRKNKNIKLAIFNNPSYLTSDGYKIFRKEFLSEFDFERGMLFAASHFADVSSAWAISFALFKEADESNLQNKNEFSFDIIESSGGISLEKTGVKTLYNCDNKVKANIVFNNQPKNDIVAPAVTSAIVVKDANKLGYSKAIGYMNNHANNLVSQENVYMASAVCYMTANKAITKKNFKGAINLFSARKLVRSNWINQKDEYLAPNENHPEFDQFYYDSIVYSLFNNSSQQSSLRQIDYKGKKWDIKNEFFWMSREKIIELAEEHNFDELYQDSKFDKDRYVYDLLFGEEKIYDKLSPDAREVLDMATSLMEKSFDMRKIVSEEHPEYHLNSWDAGYSQLKRVWKDYFPEDFKAFRDKYKEFNDRLVPMVYELGFLQK